MADSETFKKLLTEAIYRIKSLESKNISIIQDEIGYALSKKNGTMVEHWRKGNVPRTLAELEELTKVIVERGSMTPTWAQDFLTAGGHPIASKITAQLFPDFIHPLPPLPTDSLPPIAPIPTRSLMPLRHNPLFVGRSDILRQIAEQINVNRQLNSIQKKVVALNGLGGIGKTQLAAEFVHHYGQFFSGGVFWLSFEDKDSVPALVASCGSQHLLNVSPEFQHLSLHDQINLVRHAWQETTPRLLIFDNCEDPTLLEQWRPKSGGCEIIITTRRGEWEPVLSVESIPIDTLYRGDSVALLKQLIQIPESSYHPQLEEIAEEIGDLPLALHLAGRYLYRYRRVVTFDEYLSRLRESDILTHPSLTSGGISPTGHQQNVWRTFAMSYNRLILSEKVDQAAYQLLIRAAQFAPGEPIWVALLVKTLLQTEEDDNANRLLAEQGFERLIELGLIEEEGNHILHIHRLLAAFVRQVARDDVEQVKGVIQTAVLQETARVNEQGIPLPLLDFQLHLRAVANLDEMEDTLYNARLCNEIGEHFRQIGDTKSASNYFKRAVQIFEREVGKDDLETAKGYHNLGWILREEGALEKAKTPLHDALHIRQTCYGEQHPATAESHNELGRLHLNHGKLDEAKQQFEHALKISLDTLGKNHRLTADFLNNLGMTLAFQKKQSDAMPYLQDALAIRRTVLGQNHPRTALSYNNLGFVFRDLGQLDEASQAYQTALAIQQTIYGRLHPQTANYLTNLGDLCIQQENYPVAQSYLDDALEIHLEVNGSTHPATAFCYFNLGVLAEKTADIAAAIQNMGKAYDIRQEKLGEANPSTQRTRQQLEALLKKKQSLS